jgi:hypothetical protein
MLFASLPPAPFDVVPKTLLMLKDCVVLKGVLKFKEYTIPKGFPERVSIHCYLESALAVLPSLTGAPYVPSDIPGSHHK